MTTEDNTAAARDKSGIKHFLHEINKPRSLYMFLAIIIIAFTFIFGPVILPYFATKHYDNKLKRSIDESRTIVEREMPRVDIVDESIYDVVRSMNYSKLEKIIRDGVDVNQPEPIDINQDLSELNAGSTPLVIAAYNKYRNNSVANNSIEKLVRAGANIDVVDEMGRTPLLGTCLSGYGYDVLMKAGADPFKKLPDGNTVFSSCIGQFGSKYQAILSDRDHLPEDINKAILNVVGNCKSNNADAQKISVKLLLHNGADPNLVSNDGEPLLITAARNCDEDTITHLVSAGAFVDSRHTRTGETALSASLFSLYMENAEKLIELGADINLSDANNVPPIIKMIEVDAFSPDYTLYKSSGNNDIQLKILRDNSQLIQSEGSDRVVRKKYDKLEEMLLEFGADPNIESRDGVTPLMAAIENKCDSCVTLLLKYGADPLAKNIHGESAFDYVNSLSEQFNSKDRILATVRQLENLTEAERRISIYQKLPKDVQPLFLMKIHDVNTMRAAIEAGGDVNSFDILGRSPLGVACTEGRKDILDLLLEYGANPNATNNYGVSPMMYCAGRNKERAYGESGELLNDLLAAGARPNLVSDFGETALSVSIKHCGNNKFAANNIQSLLKKGADVDAHTVDMQPLTTVISQKCNPDIVGWLLKEGVSPDETDDRGNTAVMLAINSDNQTVLKALLDAGANITELSNDSESLHAIFNSGKDSILIMLLEKGINANAENKNGETLLLRASKANKDELIDVLIKYGADVNKGDLLENTPIMYAANNSNLNKVQLFINVGAKINVTNLQGNTILSHAVTRHNPEIIKLLLKSTVNINALYDGKNTYLIKAINSTIYDNVKLLIANKASTNTVDGNGVTPLIHAVLNKQFNIARLLIDSGANMNFSDLTGSTPLHYAITNGETGITRLLIEQGADLEAADGKHYTPLMNAVAKSSFAIVRFLVESGANVNGKDTSGKGITVLAVGIDNQNIKIIEYLLVQGGNPNVSDAMGQTLLARAANTGNKEIVQLLIKHGANVN